MSTSVERRHAATSRIENRERRQSAQASGFSVKARRRAEIESDRAMSTRIGEARPKRESRTDEALNIDMKFDNDSVANQ